jgi:heptosyltransferase-1
MCRFLRYCWSILKPISTSRTQINLARVRRVLAVKLSSFGDVVHVTPCLRALRRECPAAELVVAVDKTWAPILRNDPHIDALVEADPVRRHFVPSLLGARRLLWGQPGRSFDIAIDFQGRARSAAWVYASKARLQAGRGDFRPGWGTVVRPNTQRHAVAVCAEIAESLGIAVTDLAPKLFPSEKSDQALGELLRGFGAPQRDFVVANPFGTWRSKVWPLERWATTIRRIRNELHVSVLIAGGPQDEQEVALLLALLAPSPPPSMVGKMTIEEAICLYGRALLMVTGDTGPMHAAAAVGTPVVALFGATWPEQTGPWGKHHRVLQISKSQNHHDYPDDTERRHIEAIDVEMVFAAVADLLGEIRSTRT